MPRASDRLRQARWLIALAIPFGALAQPAAATNSKGTLPPFQCAALPDFAARQMTYAQAVQALQPRDFRPRVTKRSPTSAPAGVVIAQSTEQLGGNLCWSSFVLSDGSLVRVTPLRGLTRDVAAQRLQASSLRMDAREQPSDAATAGRVYDQRPQGNADVARGSVVQVAIALATTIAVPDVLGHTLSEARNSLARFTVNTRQLESVRPAEEVLAQVSPGDTQARPGTEVALTVSDGSLVEVPDLVKHPLAKAQEMLDQAGLRVATVEDTSSAPLGTMTTQQPPAGTEVRRDSVVTLHVSAGLKVPGVVGRQLSDAQASLRSFVVDAERIASERAEGEVLAQSPPAGTRAAARSRVTLRVSDGSIVAVPPLHGATLADARAALQRGGDLSAATPNGDEADARIVDASMPKAGERVKRGSTVALTVVPLTPWRAWAAGVATLLLLGGAGLYKWRHSRPPRPTPQGAAVQFSPDMEFNVLPRAELVPGRAWARQHNSEESPS
jgi:beta-lactam-binding protein with PASTA domain